MKIHVVQSGNSLWQISQLYGVTINQIIAANQLTNANQLVVGQALVIPEAAGYHIVQAGEMLWNIAQKYKVTIESILNENKITNPALIYPGQRLKLPTDFYVVKAGDTLWAISRKFGVPVQDIIRVNQITNPASIYSGQRLIIPSKVKPLIEVNAYITNIAEAGQQNVREIGEYLTYLSPFRYSVVENGGLSSFQETGLLNVAASKNVSPLMALTNFKEGKFDSNLAHAIFINNDVQDTLLNNIVQVLKEKKYYGLNIDFEYLFQQDRELYNNFLRRVVNRLHPLGYSVSTAVAPKLTREQKGLLYEAHDYKAHGEIVDFVVLMTYEWGYSGGPPMAVAPISEVRKVIEYALTEMPNRKIMMGMPLYGYDWTLPFVKGTWAPTLSPQAAVQLAIRKGVAIQYDEKSQSPFFNYVDEQGKEHVVWFEDARSVQAKYDLVKEKNLRGVSYWVLGNPFPQNWFVLADNFRIQKF
ncbi:LysM peptidoglycan-binding domain-containing protein [Bacillus sp. EB600]|uniref:LysM peptidoglycan-binding domain-containing protein n=1 Tax=Bacillus sp. EB600 TaxID=2806345 RepID=UPI002108DE95|nr:LysM peptidoglycan-binding domain-containing protein [Bacillus sp. EB600]MCQ6282102.1 LysM peptidoglycan-binding domain-containing protein [Bacillus sp. EB600]